MDYSHFSVLLLMLALALLAAEVFVPSGGFIAVLMLLSLAGSVFCAYQAWWESSPTLWWSYVASVLLLLPGVLIGAFAIFPRTAYGRRVLLDAPAPEEIEGYSKEQAELQQLVGQRGKTVTLHSPGGMVSVGGRRYHSETRGMMLDPGEEVEIVAVKGNRLVIRLADTPPPGREPAGVTEEPAEELVERPVNEPPGEPPSAEAFDPFLGESPRE
ncbi:MAG: NfeD family protein [Planctomycetaceae bacterium]